eukprot:scaffold411490_cov24-Prasinocladus_malaysianus.AAC.1
MSAINQRLLIIVNCANHLLMLPKNSVWEFLLKSCTDPTDAFAHIKNAHNAKGGGKHNTGRASGARLSRKAMLK